MKKKLFAFILFSLIFLSGCGKVDTPFVQVQLFDEYGKSISYKVASDNISGNYNGIFQKIPWFVNFSNNEETTSFLGYASMTGYMYKYTFPDLGIKFEFKDSAANYFNPKAPDFFEPLMYYSQNRIFFGKNQTGAYSTIYIFSKNIDEKFNTLINKNHSILFKNGCSATLWSGNFYELGGPSTQYEIYDIEKSGSSPCFMGTFFILNKKQPDRYYMMIRPDGCAPSCSTYTNIEFF